MQSLSRYRVPTLWRYLGIRFLSAFLGALVILALVVLVVDMLLNIDEILEARETVLGALGFLLLRTTALYLPYLIPAATFTGAFICVGQAARASEIVAIKAGGIPPLVALVPVFALAGAIAFGAGVATEWLTVPAAARLNQMRGGAEIAIRSGTVWIHTGRFIYNMSQPDPVTGTAHDVRIYERNKYGRLVRLIQASEATRVDGDRWRFSDATIRHFEPNEPADPPRSERLHEVTMELEEDRGPLLHDAELSGLPSRELLSYVAAAKAAGRNTVRASEVLHARFTIPFLVMLFALLAVPLGLSVEQTKSLSLPALQGVAILFVFVSAREYGARLVPTDSAVVLVPWGVVLVFGMFGLWQLRRTPK